MSTPPQPRFRPLAGILAECGDMVRDRLVAALAEARVAIEAELHGRRLAAADTAEAELLAEAQLRLRTTGSELERRFRAAFDQGFRRRTGAAEPASDGWPDAQDFPELALVDEEQFAESLTVQNLARQLRGATDDELRDLQPRVAHMLGATELDAALDPLAPEAICEALREACGRLEGSRQAKALLLELLSRRLATGLAPLYQDVNTHLVARQVLPRVRHGVVRRATPRAPAAAAERDAGAAPDRAGLVRRLFAADDGADLAAPRQAGSVAGAEAARAELFDLLDRLQRGEPPGSLGGAAFELADAPEGRGNVVHRLAEAGVGRRVGQVDAIVIDVVATLFDYIFEDERVPEAMKGLIGRLQIPVLKLAMRDHGFFSNRQHPARRLINGLAHAAGTWDDEFSTESPLYRIADFVVHRIQDEFADDGAVFALCLQELEDFLADQDRRVERRAAAVASQLEERERRELAQAVARNTTAGHLANPEVPAAVREFIAELWSKVLRQAALAGGEDGAAWREAAAVMDELVWSVLPKRGRDERQRLVQRLPRLLAGLRAGLDSIATATAPREAFLAELVKLHAAAVKAGMAEGAAPPPADPTAAAAAPGAGEKPADAPELEGLVRGIALELVDEAGALRRVRLTWVSPARTMYLFANRQGQRALALTRGELARRLGSGEARLADDAPLLDRIVENVLDRYQSPTAP